MEHIKLFVERLFCDFPYSEETEKAMRRLLGALTEKYNELISRGESESKAVAYILYKYDSIEKAGRLINTDLSSMLQSAFEDDVLTQTEAKKITKRLGKDSFFIAFGIACIVAIFTGLPIFYNSVIVICSAFFAFVSLFGIYGMYVYRRFTYKRCSIEKDTTSFLSIRLGIYQKRLLGSVIIFIAMFAFCSANLAKALTNTDISPGNAFYYSNFYIISASVFLLVKNMIRCGRFAMFFDRSAVKRFNSYVVKTVLASVVYWSCASAIFIGVVMIAGSFTQYWNLWIVFTCIYLFFFLLYNQTGGMKYFSSRVKISKKRFAAVLCLLVAVLSVWIMSMESWWVQPYVSTIPYVNHEPHKIVYDNVTGEYSVYMNPDSDFKILQLTDIHMGGSIFSASNDLSALNAVYQLIKSTTPDLVIVTGDFVFPLGIQSFSLNNYTPILQFSSFMRNMGIPWAFTYGNHDTEFLATHTEAQLNALFETFSYQNTKTLLYSDVQPQVTGRYNQLIRVLNTDGSVNQLLFLLDSNAYTQGSKKFNDYDYIHDDQVSWYASKVKSESEANGSTVSSLVFFHIPLTEYKTAYDLLLQHSDEVTEFYGTIGEEGGAICCPNYKSKLFDTAVDLGSTVGMFCGHDHYNNLSVEYKGIRLTYGLSIDYLVMPGIANHTEQRGGTLITLHPDSSVDIAPVKLTDIQDKINS